MRAGESALSAVMSAVPERGTETERRLATAAPRYLWSGAGRTKITEKGTVHLNSRHKVIRSASSKAMTEKAIGLSFIVVRQTRNAIMRQWPLFSFQTNHFNLVQALTQKSTRSLGMTQADK